MRIKSLKTSERSTLVSQRICHWDKRSSEYFKGMPDRSSPSDNRVSKDAVPSRSPRQRRAYFEEIGGHSFCLMAWTSVRFTRNQQFLQKCIHRNAASLNWATGMVPDEKRSLDPRSSTSREIYSAANAYSVNKDTWLRRPESGVKSHRELFPGFES